MEWRVDLAKTYEDQEKFSDAEIEYTRVLDSSPDQLEARYNRAGVRQILGRTEEALQDYRQAEALANQLVRERESDALGYEIRSRARAALGRIEDAIQDAEKALSLSPSNPSLREAQCGWYVGLRRFPEARAGYDILIRTFPENARYRRVRSSLRLALGDREGALEDAEEACRLTPNDALAHLCRGNAAADAHEAIEAYDRAIALSDRLAEAYWRRGLRKAELRDPAEPVAGYRRAIELAPHVIQWRFDLATHFYKNRDWPAAEAELTELLKLEPENAMGYAGRGEARFEQGRFPEALEDYRKAVSLREDLRAPLHARMEECRKRVEE